MLLNSIKILVLDIVSIFCSAEASEPGSCVKLAPILSASYSLDLEIAI